MSVPLYYSVITRSCNLLLVFPTHCQAQKKSLRSHLWLPFEVNCSSYFTVSRILLYDVEAPWLFFPTDWHFFNWMSLSSSSSTSPILMLIHAFPYYTPPNPSLMLTLYTVPSLVLAGLLPLLLLYNQSTRTEKKRYQTLESLWMSKGGPHAKKWAFKSGMNFRREAHIKKVPLKTHQTLIRA